MRLFCCNHTCYCVSMVSVTSAFRYVTSASHYHPRCQSRSSMYIRGLIPRNFAVLAEAVPIGSKAVVRLLLIHCLLLLPLCVGVLTPVIALLCSQEKIRTNSLFKKVQTFCEEKDFRSVAGYLGMLNPKTDGGKLKNDVFFIIFPKWAAKLKKKKSVE